MFLSNRSGRKRPTGSPVYCTDFRMSRLFSNRHRDDSASAESRFVQMASEVARLLKVWAGTKRVGNGKTLAGKTVTPQRYVDDQSSSRIILLLLALYGGSLGRQLSQCSCVSTACRNDVTRFVALSKMPQEDSHDRQHPRVRMAEVTGPLPRLPTADFVPLSHC